MRWEMGVLGASLCRDSSELSPGMHPAPHWEGPRSILDAAGNLWGIYREI